MARLPLEFVLQQPSKVMEFVTTGTTMLGADGMEVTVAGPVAVSINMGTAKRASVLTVRTRVAQFARMQHGQMMATVMMATTIVAVAGTAVIVALNPATTNFAMNAYVSTQTPSASEFAMHFNYDTELSIAIK